MNTPDRRHTADRRTRASRLRGADRRHITAPACVQYAAGLTQASQEGRAVWMIEGKCPWSWCAAGIGAAR